MIQNETLERSIELLRLAGNKTKEDLSNSELTIADLRNENEILKDEKTILVDQLNKIQGNSYSQA